MKNAVTNGTIVRAIPKPMVNKFELNGSSIISLKVFVQNTRMDMAPLKLKVMLITEMIMRPLLPAVVKRRSFQEDLTFFSAAIESSISSISFSKPISISLKDSNAFRASTMRPLITKK